MGIAQISYPNFIGWFILVTRLTHICGPLNGLSILTHIHMGRSPEKHAAWKPSPSRPTGSNSMAFLGVCIYIYCKRVQYDISIVEYIYMCVLFLTLFLSFVVVVVVVVVVA